SYSGAGPSKSVVEATCMWAGPSSRLRNDVSRPLSRSPCNSYLLAPRKSQSPFSCAALRAEIFSDVQGQRLSRMGQPVRLGLTLPDQPGHAHTQEADRRGQLELVEKLPGRGSDEGGVAGGGVDRPRPGESPEGPEADLHRHGPTGVSMRLEPATA